MNHNVPKLILDESIYIENIDARTIQSMTNKKYKKNIVRTNRVIDEKNRNFELASQQISKILIKNSSGNQLGYSSNPAIKYYQEIANSVREDSVSEVQINRAIETGITILQPQEFYSQSIKEKEGNQVSQKPRNIIANFSFKNLLEIIVISFSVGESVININVIKLVLSLLSFIKKILKLSEIKLSETEAYVISFIAQINKKNISEDELIKYIQKNCNTNIESNDIHKSITNLDKLGVISLSNGRITLIETLLI